MVAAKKKKKHAGGRPRLGDAGLTQLLSIKVTASMRAAWQAAAEAQGMSLGEWLREAAELALARGSTR